MDNNVLITISVNFTLFSHLYLAKGRLLATFLFTDFSAAPERAFSMVCYGSKVFSRRREAFKAITISEISFLSS